MKSAKRSGVAAAARAWGTGRAAGLWVALALGGCATESEAVRAPADEGVLAAAQGVGGASSFLRPDEVSVEGLVELFRANMHEAEQGRKNSITVRSDRGIRFQVIVDDERKLLVYLAHFAFKPDAPFARRLDLVNRLNARVIFTRFSVDEDGDLACDYFLSYKEGLSSKQIVESLRWMMESTLGGLDGADTDDLLR